jgi:hypothetical protein
MTASKKLRTGNTTDVAEVDSVVVKATAVAGTESLEAVEGAVVPEARVVAEESTVAVAGSVEKDVVVREASTVVVEDVAAEAQGVEEVVGSRTWLRVEALSNHKHSNPAIISICNVCRCLHIEPN